MDHRDDLDKEDTFPGLDLQTLNSRGGGNDNQQPVGSNLLNESVYVLPKTYNGKTVTELFPEFDHNAVGTLMKIFVLY